MPDTLARPSIDYPKVHEFLLACGKEHSPHAFTAELVSRLNTLCSFDRVFVYFCDANGKLVNQYLVNIDEAWSRAYQEYYANLAGGRYNCMCLKREDPRRAPVGKYEWEHMPRDEFIDQYILPQGLKSTMGFTLYDLNGTARVMVGVDRTRSEPFTPQEHQNLSAAVPHLNNLHKNFYYQQMHPNAMQRIAWSETPLTPREVEVSNLLCQGVSSANIAKTLCISVPTTYKHISNIFEKMHVSTRQELLVRLLRQQG